MAFTIEQVMANYKETECPSVTSAGMLFSRFGIEMTLYEKILAKQTVRVSQVWTDASGDLQIDGLCILIDGELVTDVVEVKNIILMKGGMEHIRTVELYFIQSKNKKSFNVNEFNHFSSGVQNFITNKSEPKGINLKIASWFKIWKSIEDEINSTRAQVNVIANMFIVFNGDRLDNDLLIDQMKIFQQNLPKSSIVTQVKYKAIGARELVEIYKRRTLNNRQQRFHPTFQQNQNSGSRNEWNNGNGGAGYGRQTQSFGKTGGGQMHMNSGTKNNFVPRSPVGHRQNVYQQGPKISINEVKEAIRQCNQDPNGYVFLADLGANVSVNGSLKYYLSKFPQHFQFDNIRLPLKVKIVGEGQTQNPVERPQFQNSSSVGSRNELKKIISGRVISVDTNDWSGTIEAAGYGNVPFYFSDLIDPEQEENLTPGSFVRFEIATWCNTTKVKSNTLLVI